MSGPVMADAWVRVVPSDAVSTGRQADRLVAGAGVFSLLYPPFPLACRSNLKHFESFQMSDTAMLTFSIIRCVYDVDIYYIFKKNPFNSSAYMRFILLQLRSRFLV